MISLAAAADYYRTAAHRTGLAAVVCTTTVALLNTLQSAVPHYDESTEAVHTVMLVVAQVCVVLPRVLFLQTTQGIASRANKLLLQVATLGPAGVRERYDHLVAHVPPMPCLLTHPTVRWDDPSAAPVLVATSSCRAEIDLQAVVRYYTNLRTACVLMLALEWVTLSALAAALAVLHDDRRGTWCIVLQCAHSFVVVLAHKVPLHRMATVCSRIVRLAMVGMSSSRSAALDAELRDELAGFHCCGETRFTPCRVSTVL